MATATTPDRPGRMLGQLAAHLQAHPDLVKAAPAMFVTNQGVKISITADHYLTWRRHCLDVQHERLLHADGDTTKVITALVTIGDFTYILEALSWRRTENAFRALVGWGAFDQAKAV